MTNEHHSAYWCGKPAVNLDAAVLTKVTKKAKIAILGNVIAVNDQSGWLKRLPCLTVTLEAE
ncbi:MAG: hypothetical protein Ct9H300mP11_07010 [Chloroflexota bacterium]|nr:MAG: hypothetical protein Ct9H300mP11_07010 [Chloroflexota bacterium]